MFAARWAFVVSLSLVGGSAPDERDNPAGQQLLDFKRNASHPIGLLTTDLGAPVSHKDAYYTLDQELIRNNYLIESLAHFNRENIPLRIVHSKAAGAFGYFQVTNDMSHITKAKVFCGVGRKTRVAVRFSPAQTQPGGTDLGRRENRGLATKFYTEEGNFDLTTLITPIFSIKDPVFFVSLNKVAQRNPVTNLRDPNRTWDFMTKRPETLFSTLFTFSPRGVPYGYEHMQTHALHTFQLVNEKGEYHFVKFRWVPDAGVKSLPPSEIERLVTTDPDFHTRRLYNQIYRGDYPSWTLKVQVMSLEEVKRAKFDPFDLTRMWPDKYPLQQVGRMVLDENPSNFFADVTQIALSPGNLVPGILGAPDKVFEARAFAYRDAQIYRLGVNFPRIPVNCPLASVHNINRNGRPPVLDNQDGAPDYLPNSFNGPVPTMLKGPTQPIRVLEDDAVDNFDQAREFYLSLKEQERRSLIENLAGSIRDAYGFLQERAVKMFSLIHPDLGHRLAYSLHANTTAPDYLH